MAAAVTDSQGALGHQVTAPAKIRDWERDSIVDYVLGADGVYISVIPEYLYSGTTMSWAGVDLGADFADFTSHIIIDDPMGNDIFNSIERWQLWANASFGWRQYPKP